MTADKKRILIVQPSVQPPGGGNGVAAWMIQALHDRHELSLLTLEPFDAASVNSFYGTAIDEARVNAIQGIPRIYPWLKRLKTPLALLKSSLLMRHLRGMRDDFDLIITANNEADLRRRGIQYVHYPTYKRPRPNVDRRSYHVTTFMNGYYAMCDRIAGVTREGVKRNRSLVNSDWTGRIMSKWYDGQPTTTLYPPVAGDFPDVPWERRNSGFVCIGRIAPEKDLDRVFDILAAVRHSHPDVHLHLVGTRGRDDYSRHVLNRVEENREWVTLHENIPRSELVELVSSQRFGIHGMGEEHFGMGVAEMVRAGCIVWTPNGGGQVEILGRDERLLFKKNAEAVEKIERALTDPAYADSLREALRPQRERFSEESFVEHFLTIVDDFFATEARETREPRRAHA